MIGPLALTILPAFLAGQAQEPDIDQALARMLTVYREYGLPMPSPKARPILIQTGVHGTGGVGPNEELVTLGLLDEGGKVFEGVEVTTESELKGRSVSKEKTFRLIDTGDPMLVHVLPDEGGKPFRHDNLLACAIQLWAIGRTDLARTATLRSKEGENRSSGTSSRRSLTPERAVSQMALSYAINSWIEPGSDRVQILALMKSIQARAPLPAEEWGIQAREYREGMEAALKPRQQETAGAEAVIDRLADTAGRSPLGATYLENSTFRDLVRLGFKGIPTMFDHLQDKRLTRMLNMDPFGYHILTVGGVVRQALFLFRSDDTHMNPGWVDDRDLVSWWASAKMDGEEAYCRKHILPPPRKPDPGKPAWSQLFPNEACIAVCEVRYPQILRTAYDYARKHRKDIDLGSLDTALGQLHLHQGGE